jgi:hypothetical protein
MFIFDPSKSFYLILLIFLVETFAFNVYPNLPRLPGDLHIDRPGLMLTIPVISPLVIGIILFILLKAFGG